MYNIITGLKFVPVASLWQTAQLKSDTKFSIFSITVFKLLLLWSLLVCIASADSRSIKVFNCSSVSIDIRIDGGISDPFKAALGSLPN